MQELTAGFKKRHPFVLQQFGGPRYFSCIGAIVCSIDKLEWLNADRPNWTVRMLHRPAAKEIPYPDLLMMRGMGKEEMEAELARY